MIHRVSSRIVGNFYELQIEPPINEVTLSKLPVPIFHGSLGHEELLLEKHRVETDDATTLRFQSYKFNNNFSEFIGFHNKLFATLYDLAAPQHTVK